MRFASVTVSIRTIRRQICAVRRPSASIWIFLFFSRTCQLQFCLYLVEFSVLKILFLDPKPDKLVHDLAPIITTNLNII